ncbi:hypothetical protein GW17_00052605 [Ensete ventricosum]|nr:hypothetical protein GW17_00052605 [Ensete ventricosum]
MLQGGKVLLYTGRISPNHATVELEGEGEVQGGVESGKGKLVEGTDGNRDSTRFDKERQSSRHNLPADDDTVEMSLLF